MNVCANMGFESNGSYEITHVSSGVVLRTWHKSGRVQGRVKPSPPHCEELNNPGYLSRAADCDQFGGRYYCVSCAMLKGSLRHEGTLTWHRDNCTRGTWNVRALNS
jgi:hypothetical protein